MTCKHEFETLSVVSIGVGEDQWGSSRGFERCIKCDYLREIPAQENGDDQGMNKIDHPQHYGGKDNPYEAIKVIEAWQLGFCLGNTIKYISRAGLKDDAITDLKKARWYLDREISSRERQAAAAVGTSGST